MLIMERGNFFQKIKNLVVEERVGVMTADEVTETVETPEGTFGKIPRPGTPLAYLLERRIRPFNIWYLADFRMLSPIKPADPEKEQPMPEHL